MNCNDAKDLLTLYVYGELEFDSEELFEQHLQSCPACRTGLQREQSLHQALDLGQMQPSPELLHACRREFRSRIETTRAARQLSFTARLKRFFTETLASPRLLRPAGALALVAVGFFGARLWDATSDVNEPSVLRIRNLSPAHQGSVQLVLEEVRQKTMTGRLDDDHIRRMLLAAAADPSDPGLRARTMDVLKDRGEQVDVRRALLAALRQDSNPGVRLKALEGLKPFARDPETRKVLSQVLLADDNPGVRTQAIDLLVENMQTEVIGTLQELIIREDNPVIRQKSLKALREANASVETF